MEKTGREGETLFPSSGKLTGELLLPSFEAESGDALPDDPASVFHPIHAGDKVEILGDAEIFVEAETLCHVSDLAFDLLTFPDDVKPKAGATPGIGAEEAAEHTNEGGLATSIWAEEAIDFALANLQIDPVDDGAIPEAFCHPSHIDGELLVHLSGE